MTDDNASPKNYISASECNEILFRRETKLIKAMDSLYQAFSTSANEDLNINSLTLEDFGVSKDLYEMAKQLHKHNVHNIPASENRRNRVAYIAIALG